MQLKQARGREEHFHIILEVQKINSEAQQIAIISFDKKIFHFFKGSILCGQFDSRELKEASILINAVGKLAIMPY